MVNVNLEADNAKPPSDMDSTARGFSATRLFRRKVRQYTLRMYPSGLLSRSCLRRRCINVQIIRTEG